LIAQLWFAPADVVPLDQMAGGRGKILFESGVLVMTMGEEESA